MLGTNPPKRSLPDDPADGREGRLRLLGLDGETRRLVRAAINDAYALSGDELDCALARNFRRLRKRMRRFGWRLLGRSARLVLRRGDLVLKFGIDDEGLGQNAGEIAFARNMRDGFLGAPAGVKGPEVLVVDVANVPPGWVVERFVPGTKATSLPGELREWSGRAELDDLRPSNVVERPDGGLTIVDGGYYRGWP